jgi:hypothetical protein
MKANDAIKQNRRGFLQIAGVAAATFALGGMGGFKSEVRQRYDASVAAS